MNVIKKIIFGILAITVLLAVAGIFLPSKYQLERSVTILAPADIVFDNVNDLKKNEDWSPWKAADPTVKISYGSLTEGKGASYSWEGKKSGRGIYTIMRSEPGKSLEADMDFKEMGRADGYFTFVPEGKSVKVTQGMRGDNGWNIPHRYMSLLTDRVVGPMFESGLAKLKALSEAQAVRPKEAGRATGQASFPSAGGAAAAKVKADSAVPKVKAAPAAD